MDSAFLFITDFACVQLKARGEIFLFILYSNADLKAWTYPFVSGIHKRILKPWLTVWMSNLCLFLSDDRMISWDRKIQPLCLCYANWRQQAWSESGDIEQVDERVSILMVAKGEREWL